MGTFAGRARGRRPASRGRSAATPSSTARSTSSCSVPRRSRRARTIARDDVTSFIREPFVEGERGRGPVETGDLRQAIGELVTCSRCVGTWVAAGLTSTQMIAPRFGRLLTWSLAAAGANDFLQAGFAALTSKRTSSTLAQSREPRLRLSHERGLMRAERAGERLDAAARVAGDDPHRVGRPPGRA